MTISQSALLAALAGAEPIEDVCRASGATAAELAAARDAFLAGQGAIGDAVLTGPVGGRVEILRDRAGVPHIHAGTTADLYFGLGVAMAEDRLWQMDRLRRRALGRQAEILGPKYLAADIAHRTVGIPRMAEREPALMDGATYATAAAFVSGINYQIARYGDALPVEFRLLGYAPEPFTVGCVVAIGRGIWWSLNGRIDRLMAAEAARFLPEAARAAYLTPEASESLVLPDGGSLAAGSDDQTGSNNWAVAGGLVPGGKALLAGDPHQPFWVPSSWYEYGLHGPEDDAAGCGHPGFPGLWWGSNGRVAWSLTNNMASTRDLYRETVHPTDPAYYRDGDVWRPFDEQSCEIAVRGGPTHRLTVRSTVRGPIVNALVPALAEGGEPPLSLRWVGAEHMDDLRASLAISRAKDWQGFRAALRDWSVAVFNFVYADAAGNVGYQMAGRVPVRGRVTYGLRDADRADDRWTGYVPFDGLPHSYNPARGYVASANQRIVPPDYPHTIYGAYSQGHRGIRIDQVFAGGTADHAATTALQNDIKNVRAERVCPDLLAALAGSADADASGLAALLAGWDYRYGLDSAAPTVFETFMFHWQRRVLGQHVPGRLLDLASQQTNLGVALLADPAMAYFPDGTRPAAVAAAKDAMAALRARLGDDPATWTWGRVHLAHWSHALSNPANAEAFDIGPAPVAGGSHTVCNTGGELPPHGAGSGAEYRIIVDFAAPASFLAVQNIGNSGVPGSPHYRDQFADWLAGRYHVVHLDRAAIEADLESRTVIEPA
ncbi:penicillin amidase [Stella humosa]|uniref:Penicillin amidase n=1 Tax=Stella humosa TaxID=94 RepID=A0A3N1KS04_9PROT|nr:penicillin acylase family protein [Stella humosa]ROP81170.1 penicillin amidase [Stella humosa]BBK32516.1 penicillin amidase [Stella humosa]